MLAALFGCVVGQAVTFYTATFYAYYFLERIARVDAATTTVLTGVATRDRRAAGARLRLAERPSRPQATPAGGPRARGAAVLPALRRAARGRESGARAGAGGCAGRVRADPAECALQFDPMGRRAFDGSSCDVVAILPRPRRRRPCDFRARIAVPGAARNRRASSWRRPTLRGWRRCARGCGRGIRAARARRVGGGGLRARRTGGTSTGRESSPSSSRCSSSPRSSRRRTAALLAELFPARIRYTALSFPQNFGNGWFGGLLPAVAFTIVAATGNVFAGLWYPVGLSALCLVVGALALPETRGRPIDR